MISIRMSETAENQLKEVAQFEGLTVSEYVRRIIDEKLTDLYDLKIGLEALAEYEKNPVTYSLDDVFRDK